MSSPFPQILTDVAAYGFRPYITDTQTVKNVHIACIAVYENKVGRINTQRDDEINNRLTRETIPHNLHNLHAISAQNSLTFVVQHCRKSIRLPSAESHAL